MTMVNDDDRLDSSVREKMSANIWVEAAMRSLLRELRRDEEEKEERSRATKLSSLRKRKVDECESQQEDTNQDASSPSLSTFESKRRLVVPNEPIRAEPVREKKPVKRNPVRREPPVRRERGMTPEWLDNLMREENGVDAKLIFEKKLQATDLKTDQQRLLIPWNQIVEMDFLNEAELRIIDKHYMENRRRRGRRVYRKNGIKGLDVILVDSNGGKWDLNLRRWDMRTTSNYALVTGWSKVCLHNRLRVDQTIHLWSFHSQGRLYFALVPPTPAPVMEPHAQAPRPEVDEESLRRIFVDFPRRRRGTSGCGYGF